MSLPLRISFVFLSILTALLMAWGVVGAEPGPPAAFLPVTAQGAPTPMPLPNRPGGLAPDLSTIDSPAAGCALPKAHTDACYVTWSYLYATADPNYVITMTVNIDGKNRARFGGFFQTSVYIPSEMLSFRVPCGMAGSGGDPGLGSNHSYIISGRDSAGLVSTNSGTVTCPADDFLHVYLTVVRK
jgi:hypothetical protein